jgi:hypothetical protein
MGLVYQPKSGSSTELTDSGLAEGRQLTAELVTVRLHPLNGPGLVAGRLFSGVFDLLLSGPDLFV